MSVSAEHRLRRALEDAGLNAPGVVSREAWNATVPAVFRASGPLEGAAVAVVVGAGGRALFEAFRAAPEPRLDAYTERVVTAAAAALGEEGFATRCVYAHRPRDGVFADFVALGRAAGLGWPSRLGLLLHPTFGPWMSLRAAILTDAPLTPALPLPGEGPCPECAAPCATVCPGRALDGGHFDVARCGTHRRSDPACRSRCAARRHCVLGVAHGYLSEAEAHHMAASWAPMVGDHAP